ncbi:aldo/keto reductase [Cellulomonas chitinilytica]|uniref:Aldo/keto reductase n=1 Tax=Cellulomonas chitinilytica TaxID=398759 RepID=A0A919P1L1_9CELL|nr:aldo/keto reductase [Cellulomonas chitinilytica]GIG19981.1 aldo/keto reductase [Cellulomonas chitinilytica]
MTAGGTAYLGRTGVPVSRLTLGAMNFGEGAPSGTDEAIRIVHAALDAGITVIDTADVYTQGASEELLRTALAGRRDDVFLASKFHGQIGKDPRSSGNSRRWVVRAVEDSLRRLGTDHLDLYQAHRPDPHTDLLETLGVLDDLVRQGKIRYHGTSVFPVEDLVEAQHLARENRLVAPATEQVPYSALIRGIERGTLPVARRFGLGVLTFGPLAAGWLSGAYRQGAPQPATTRSGKIPGRFDVDLARNAPKLAAADALARLAEEHGLTLVQLSVAFALHHPDVSSVIVGPRTVEHLHAYLDAAETVLSDEVLDRIDEIVAPGTTFVERDNGVVLPALTPARLRRPQPTTPLNETGETR